MTPVSAAFPLAKLEDVRRRYRFVVLGYVVMLEHIHLLVRAGAGESVGSDADVLRLEGCVPERGLELSTRAARRSQQGVGETLLEPGTPAGCSACSAASLQSWAREMG
jgi:hypothetical protein